MSSLDRLIYGNPDIYEFSGVYVICAKESVYTDPHLKITAISKHTVPIVFFYAGCLWEHAD